MTQNFKSATKWSGLSLYPNSLSEAPPGSLNLALNVNIDRPGIITPRTGQQAFTAANSSLGSLKVLSRIFQSNATLYGFFTADGLPASSGQVARLDSGTSSAAVSQNGVSATVPPPGNAIHSFLANKSTYLTTDDGIAKLMALYSGSNAGDIVPAGMPYALDVQAALSAPTANTLGWLAGNSATAYRTVFGNTDPNGIITLGAPSPPVTVQNPTLTSQKLYPGGTAPYAGTFTVDLPYTVGGSGVSYQANCFLVQGGVSVKGVLQLVSGSSIGTCSINADQGLQYFGPNATALTAVVTVYISAVASTALTLRAFTGDPPGTIFSTATAGTPGLVISQPLNTAAPSALVGATAVSQIASTTATVITAASGSAWTAGPLAIQLPATVRVAQTNAVFFDTTSAGTAPQVGDLLQLPGAASKVVVVSPVVSSGGTTKVPLASFPTGAVLSSTAALAEDETTTIFRPQNVSVSFVCPKEIAPYIAATQSLATFVQVYRSYVQFPMTAGAFVTPTDNMQLCYQQTLTSAQVSSPIVTFVDIAPDATLGATLYTSPNQQGIGASQYPPPVASDGTLYQGTALYANCYLPASLSTGLLAVTNTTNIVTTGTTSASAFTMSVSSSAGLLVGMSVTGPGIPAGTLIFSISGTNLNITKAATSTNSGVNYTFSFPNALQNGDTITINGITLTAGTNFVLSVGSGSVTADITNTVNNLARAVNTYPILPTAAGSTNEQVTMLGTSTPSSMGGTFVMQTSRGLGSFTFTSSKPGAFTTMPTAAVTATKQGNALYYSQTNQPEAVPLLNSIMVGEANYDIQRVVPLAGSCLIFKPEGIYQLTGTTSAQYSVSLLNSTAKLLSNESAVQLQSSVMAFTNQGVVTINSGGVQIASLAINDDLNALVNLPSFASTSFGVAHENERRYMLWTPSVAGDTLPTQAYAYNINTNAWTKWLLPRTCGLVNEADSLLYMGSAVASPVTGSPAVYQERSAGLEANYGDEQVVSNMYADGGYAAGVAYTMQTVSGQEAAIAAAFAVGSALVTPTGTFYPTSIGSAGVGSGVRVIFNPPALGLSPSSALVQAYTCKFEPIPIVGDDTGSVKQFQEFSITFTGTSCKYISATCQTDFNQEATVLPLVPIAQAKTYGGWGALPWGSFAWGAPPVYNPHSIATARQFVSRMATRGHAWWPTVTCVVAASYFGAEALSLTWTPLNTTRER